MERADFVKGFTFKARERRHTELRKMRVVDPTHHRYCIVEDVQIGCKETFLWVDLIQNISADYEFIFPVLKQKTTA